MRIAFLVIACCAALSLGGGVELVVELPEGAAAVKATAANRSMKLSSDGAADGGRVTFANLLPDTPYDLSITLKDGSVLLGADLGWYNDEPAKADAGPMDDDDREQVRAIVQDVPSFYNKSHILRLEGDHDRAVGLVELIRDKDFHAGKGEVVWRVEVWYFKNQAGGWERVNQQGIVLDRQRFKDRAAYEAYVRPRRWAAELGGVRVSEDQKRRTVKLPAEALRPASRPAGPASRRAGD